MNRNERLLADLDSQLNVVSPLLVNFSAAVNGCRNGGQRIPESAADDSDMLPKRLRLLPLGVGGAQHFKQDANQGEPMKKLFLVALSVALTACASSHVIVGKVRAPISPDQVQVYLQPPANAETIAMLEANDMGANGFSQQSRVNKVMKRLKKEAADLGANGIVLQGMGSEYAGSVGSGFATGNGGFASGFGFSAAQMRKVGQAVAVYVDPNTVQPNK